MIETNLSELLKSHDISINELSEKINIGRKPLTQLANNESKMVKFDTIEKIMNYFQLSSFDQLLTLSISDEYSVSGKVSERELYSDLNSYGVKIYINDANASLSLPIFGNVYIGDKSNIDIELTGYDDIEIDSQTINFIYRVLNKGKYYLEVLARDIALTILDMPEIQKESSKIKTIIFRMPQISEVPEGVYFWNKHDLEQPDFVDFLADKYNLDD
ncbi:helix-turn-helix domain-containing protein [Levilactobacillus brevis]|uniref:helix-turn-helix domain-containing protein n=1 Tax=Levilactobacillus brevis TaxID=1580 RepID=UPI0030CFD891